MGDRAQLAAFLGTVRARLRLRETAREGAVAFAAAAGALLGVLVGAGLFGPAPVWRSLGWAIVVGALVAGGRAVLKPLFAWRGDEAVARFVGKATGTGDLLLSASELGAAFERLGSYGASTELARAVIAQALDRSRSIDPKRLIDLRPARRASAAAAAVAAAWLCGALVAPGLLGRGFTALAAHATAIEAAAEPILGDLDLELTFPKHTGLPPRSIPGTSGAVLAPPGTQVSLHARALVPAETADLLVEDAQGKLLATRQAEVKGTAIRAAFTVTQPGGYRFAIKPPSGRPVREADLHRIEVEPDRPPRVDLAAPADDLEVAGPKKIELAWSADDDFGLASIELVWRAATSDGGKGGEQRKPLRTIDGQRSASGRLEWDLAELDLTPGVRVAYHVEARDNDDVSGPNVGSSRTLYVRIYSPTEKHEEVVEGEQALVEHAVQLLADRIDVDRFAALPDVDSASQLSPRRELDDWTTAHAKTEAFLAELGRVAAGLDKDTLAPKDLKPTLAAVGERLGRLSRDEDAALHALKERGHKVTLERAAMKPLREGNGKHVAELERDVLLLDDLVDRQRMEELLAVADEMAKARDRLKGLLEQYRKTRSEAVRRDIERELRALERRLAELGQKMSRLSGEVPDEFLNREAMGDGDMQKRLDSIKSLLDKGDVDQAAQELARLSQTLDKMVSTLEGDLRGFRGERFSAEEKALSELEDRLADLEHDERQLQQEAENLRTSQKQKAQELMRDRVEPLLSKLKQETQEMRGKLGEVDPQTLPPFDDESLDQSRRGADDVGRALDQSDLDQARAAARKTEESLRTLGEELRREEERQWEGMKQTVRRARDRVDEAGALAKRLAQEIDDALPRTDDLLGPADRKRMEELRSQQEATRKRAEEARRTFAEKAKEAGASLGDGMKEAERHMQKAGERFGAGDARDSAGEAGQAADQLGKMRQQAQQERRPRKDGGAGAGACGSVPSTLAGVVSMPR